MTGGPHPKMRVRFGRGTGGSMHMLTVPEHLRRTFTQGQWSADCPLCPDGAYPTQYRPSFRDALDYADRHARGHAGHVDVREVAAALRCSVTFEDSYVTWGFSTRPYPASHVAIEDPNLDQGVASLRLTTESVANTYPGAVPGWSWSGQDEPIRGEDGAPLGPNAPVTHVVAAAVRAARELEAQR